MFQRLLMKTGKRLEVEKTTKKIMSDKNFKIYLHIHLKIYKFVAEFNKILSEGLNKIIAFCHNFKRLRSCLPFE